MKKYDIAMLCGSIMMGIGILFSFFSEGAWTTWIIYLGVAIVFISMRLDRIKKNNEYIKSLEEDNARLKKEIKQSLILNIKNKS